LFWLIVKFRLLIYYELRILYEFGDDGIISVDKDLIFWLIYK